MGEFFFILAFILFSCFSLGCVFVFLFLSVVSSNLAENREKEGADQG